jgi:hypothetical protein
MHRREFLGTLTAAPLAIHAQSLTGKRTFEITTRLELPGARGRTVAWIPLPLSRTRRVPYQEVSNGIARLDPRRSRRRGKVILEEKAGATLDDPYITKARDTLFGSWEMNWIAYNDAHDVSLPGSMGKPLPFLMYPQAEVDGVRRDSLDPAAFKYTITARQV